jgi:hypothetical protein
MAARPTRRVGRGGADGDDDEEEDDGHDGVRRQGPRRRRRAVDEDDEDDDDDDVSGGFDDDDDDDDSDGDDDDEELERQSSHQHDATPRPLESMTMPQINSVAASLGFTFVPSASTGRAPVKAEKIAQLRAAFPDAFLATETPASLTSSAARADEKAQDEAVLFAEVSASHPGASCFPFFSLFFFCTCV